MFQGALSSGSFDLSRWDTSELLDVSHMFDTPFLGIEISGVSNWDCQCLFGEPASYAFFAPWGIKVDGMDWVYWFQEH